MRRMLLMTVAAASVFALAACGQKTEQASETTTDSLLSANPLEQTPGDISPQTDYQSPPEPQAEPPAPAPSRPASRPPSSRPSKPSQPAEQPAERGTLVEAGTPINIAVSTQISSETANVGDTWTGEVKEAVIVGGEVVIPAGAQVVGVVNGVRPAEKGSRAAIDLAVSSVDVNGKSYPVTAGTDSIIAGSTRARNIGAIAGSAAAGALIGKAVGGSGKGAVIGGLIGGAAATGAVAKSKGFQVVIKEGTVITFSVNKDVRVRT